MANVGTLELVSQENGLIKSTPAEETLIRLAKMRAESMKAENGKIRIIAVSSLRYIVQYFRRKQGFSIKQVENLSSEDLNRLPDIILRERAKKILLLGWIPIFGWYFAGEYFLFNNRIKFLRLLGNEEVFDAKDIPSAINSICCGDRNYW